MIKIAESESRIRLNLDEAERQEFLQDLQKSREAYKSDNHTQCYNILLSLILRLEQLGVDFNEERKVIHPDTGEVFLVNIRQRFYDLMRGDIQDDPVILTAYRKDVKKYEETVWNMMGLELDGTPELLPPDPETGQVVKIVFTKSGGALELSDWYRLWNYLLRQLDMIAPILERKVMNILSVHGMAI